MKKYYILCVAILILSLILLSQTVFMFDGYNDKLYQIKFNNHYIYQAETLEIKQR